MDLTDRKLGEWQVIRYHSKRGKNHRWVCRCLRCNEEFLVWESQLLSTQKRRVGCSICYIESLIKQAKAGCRYCGHPGKSCCLRCHRLKQDNGMCCGYPRNKDGCQLCLNPTSRTPSSPPSPP